MLKPHKDRITKEMRSLRERLAAEAWAILKADAIAVLQDPLLDEFVYGMGTVFFTKPLRKNEWEHPVIVGKEVKNHCLTPGEDCWDMRGLSRTTRRRMAAFAENWEWYLGLFGNPGPVRFKADGVETADW